MALLHRADLTPSKLELLNAWLPTRSWYTGPAEPDLAKVGAFRLDDPAGAVGVETMLVRAGDGPVLQVPLTYRDAPLAGAERWLIGTTEHSVLGTRWVYDAAGDPVYAAALATIILTGAGQAVEEFEVDGVRQARANELQATGSGRAGAAVPAVTGVLRVADTDPTLIATDSLNLTVIRVLTDDPAVPDGAPTLTATWPGSVTARLLACAG
ncbi:hypothetical protein ACFO1B_38220 [Dactylosporangium siamense]|uniref:Maltokinase N-terminal cap domain-containing protein n=1 Tax=Dactylosporangium siamense TaxID=685454 RepID=A0A919PUN8_9ACTN|nr:hypothetical protein [Dactylosporangium siamense]GIG49611.1 hypothetical protein Dsi01nite_076520 [Dactylosporangium siamense]